MHVECAPPPFWIRGGCVGVVVRKRNETENVGVQKCRNVGFGLEML